MEPYLRLKLSPQRSLTMTFALGQALEILQMPQLELGLWLAQEIEKNPLLQETPSSKPLLPHEELPAPLSLYDHLMAQIRESLPLRAHQEIAEELLEHLDEKGFIATPIEEIRALVGVPLEELLSILEILQTFDPPGIFARNLQESLLLQLKARGENNSPPFYLVQECFDDLIHGRYTLIKKKMGAIDLESAIHKLARLRLRPTESFKKEPTPFALADLRITHTDAGWFIATCEEELPKLILSSAYTALQPDSAEERDSLRTWTTAAKWLIRSVKRRRQILLQVGALLIRKQARYLAQKGPLQPLTLQAIAAHLQLHESTLSRALSGKYAETPRGLIPLRSLFTSAPATEEAKAALLHLIAAESKQNPLTDEELSAALQSKGFAVARRTVAKYRKELKIRPTASRKYG